MKIFSHKPPFHQYTGWIMQKDGYILGRRFVTLKQSMILLSNGKLIATMKIKKAHGTLI
jgi:hypothetical protein